MVTLTDIDIDEDLIKQLQEMQCIYRQMGLGRIPFFLKGVAGYLLSSTLYSWMIAELNETLSQCAQPVYDYSLSCQINTQGSLDDCHLQQTLVDWHYLVDEDAQLEAMQARQTLMQVFGAAFTLYATKEYWLPSFQRIKSLCSPLLNSHLNQQLQASLARLDGRIQERLTGELDPLNVCLLDFFHQQSCEVDKSITAKFLDYAQQQLPDEYFDFDEAEPTPNNVSRLRMHLKSKLHARHRPSNR